MNEQEENIKRLSFENFIWIVFIVISVLSIYSDELMKKSIRFHDQQADKHAKDIFTKALLITLIIYVYFVDRNYHDLKKHPNEKSYEVRFIGSISLLFGVLCLLYFQFSLTQDNGSASNF